MIFSSRFSTPVWLAAGLAAVLLAAVSIAAVAIAENPRAFVEAYATHRLGRAVTIGALQVHHIRPLQIELDDLHLANPGWSDAPDMLTIRHASAELDPATFFSGPLQVRRLAIDGFRLELERDRDGTGNWQTGKAVRESIPPAARAAQSRRNMPTVLNLQLQDSGILFHTSGGATLKIAFKALGLETPDETRPVKLTVDGAYNDVPVRMAILTEPYAVFHKADQPFGADIKASGASISIETQLKMMDPLNFDNAEGPLHVDVKKIGEAGALFGSVSPWNLPLVLDSILSRQGDVWNFTELRGKLASHRIKTGRIQLTEGARRQPDNVQADMSFDTLDISALLPPAEPAKPGNAPSWLAIDPHPSSLLDISLTADTATYRALTATNLKLHASRTADAEAIDALALTIWNGRLQASASAQAAGKETRVRARADLVQADAAQILRLVQVDKSRLSGTARLTLSAAAQGSTVAELEKTANGRLTLQMRQGQIARSLVRLASTDLRSLFGRDDASVPLTCLTAAAVFKNGIGALAPFMVQTGKGTLLGAGTIDLPRHALDITFQTDPRTTSDLALDVPIRVVGALDSPHIVPALSHNPVDVTQEGRESCTGG